ncbi:clostripain-related cysteine peptidase, partial [Chloroflexota bacterium]
MRKTRGLNKIFSIVMVMAIMFISPLAVLVGGNSSAQAAPGAGGLSEEWSYSFNKIDYYQTFVPSPGIADLGINNNVASGEVNSDLEIITGTDEYYGYQKWYAFNAQGGTEWQLPTGCDESRSPVTIADIDGDGDLEISGGTTSGWKLQVFSHTGQHIWQYPSGGFWAPSPAIADVLPGTAGLEVIAASQWNYTVWCFNGITGAKLWTYNTGGYIDSSPAVGDVDGDGNMEVVIGSDNGKVHVLNGQTGVVEWTYSTGSAVKSSAALVDLDADANLEIVIGSNNGYVYCLDGSAGTVQWSYSTGGAVYSSPAIANLDSDANLEIVVGSDSNKVYCLDGSSGTAQWTYTTGGDVRSSPAIAWRGTGYGVYVGSTDDYLYMLNGTTGALIDRFDTGATYGITSSPAVADVDGDGKLEIVFTDSNAIPDSSTTTNKFWCLEDGGSNVNPHTIEWQMFRNDARHTGVYAPSTTFMVYMAADNDLEDMAIADLNEMEMAGSTDKVNIVAMLDRIPGYDSSNGNWDDTRVFKVNKDTSATIINSPVVDSSLGEKNMGNPQTLIDFVEWTMTNYPASRYVLVVWDYGSGWKSSATNSLCRDDTSTDNLTMAELQTALQTVYTDTGATMDMVGFDASKMQMLEVAYQIKDYAGIMVGSEDAEPAEGWPYDTILQGLTADPAMTLETLAEQIVTKYTTSYEPATYETQSAVWLSTKLDTVAIKTSELAQAIMVAGDWTAVDSAKTAAEKFSDLDYIDLYDFANLMKTNSSISAVDTKADELMAAITAVMIAEDDGSSHAPNANGLSIYFPASTYDTNYDTLDFAVDTLWDDMLKAFYGVSGAPSVDLDDFSDYTNDTTPTLTGTAADPSGVNIVSVEYQVDSTAGTWLAATASDGSFNTSSEVFTFTISPALSDGSHTVYVRATNATGTVSSNDTETFTVDTAVPIVTITALTPDPTSDNTPTLSGTATDALSPITKVEYQVDSGSWIQANFTPSGDPKTGTYTFTTSELSDAPHTVNVRSYDSAGNVSATDDDTFVVYTGKPVVILDVFPAYTNNTTPTLTGTATDLASNITSVKYRIDIGSWQDATASDGTFDSISESFTFTTTTLAATIHVIEVY